MAENIVSSMEQYFDRLWPICRSITGEGVRQSIKILQEIIPLEVHEIESGSEVFDWKVPKEWNITDAYIIAPDGQKVVDFKSNNLHVMSYSSPINKSLQWDELDKHLHYIEEIPDAIPYRTSYYKEAWGFCLSKHQYDNLPKEGTYEVVIKSELAEGVLNYADLVLPGESSEEIFFSSYICHPSMANNELSGPLLLAHLYQYISKIKNRRYTYRFLLAPETIGSIVYLAKHGEHLKSKMKAGYILTCVGLDEKVTYKRSRQGTAYCDNVAEHVLEQYSKQLDYEIIDFFPFGSDERQYCSPGFDLPVGSAVRGMYGDYPEYHTSLDNKELISLKALKQMLDLYCSMVDVIEKDVFLENTNPYCEPQLGKRGVYPTTGGEKHGQEIHAMLWLLNLSDGNTSLRDIQNRSGIDADLIDKAADDLKDCGLLK